MKKWDVLLSFPRETAQALQEGQDAVRGYVKIISQYGKKPLSITLKQVIRKDGKWYLYSTIRYRNALFPYRGRIELDGDVYAFRRCKVVFGSGAFCTFDVDLKGYLGHTQFTLTKEELFDTCGCVY